MSVLMKIWCQKGHTCRQCPRKCLSLQKWENNILSKGASMISPRGGRRMLPHQNKTSMVLFCRMAHTRGGTVQAVASPRVYTNLLGVNVCKVHGGYMFQPASLKVSSYLALDRYSSKVGQPRSQLYEGVQKFLGKVIDQVEDRLLGIDGTGI